MDETIRQGKEVLSYALVPKVSNKMKIRFVITGAGMGTSGFHTLVSVKEANEILEYLKAGDSAAIPADVAPQAASSVAQSRQTWEQAQVILSFSDDKSEAKDQRKRQLLERSVKGLVGELASVFKITLKEAIAKVQKSLGNASKVNPLVLMALANAGED